ncbi:hypothetical protein FNV43_RR04519 [Rhamnella rubrinervis]|uniref:Uncharacterized protein n=1 Tax=Rhamnella rubrinervis TaxID=2594499 RepID=A0A8K0MPV0_9ROSA|nr:hypothetical protein FNV43_RR04519 [Rhamnella rubrinervis]
MDTNYQNGAYSLAGVESHYLMVSKNIFNEAYFPSGGEICQMVADPNIVEFHFGGIDTRFDQHAFAVVSGLNCGTVPRIGEMVGLTNRLWNKNFGSIGIINVNNMITKFKKYPFVESEVDNNVFICMFCLLEIVFLSVHHKFVLVNAPINSSHDEPIAETSQEYGKEPVWTFPSYPHHISSSPNVAMFNKKIEGRFEIVEMHWQQSKNIRTVCMELVDKHHQCANEISSLSGIVRAIMHRPNVEVHCFHYFT